MTAYSGDLMKMKKSSEAYMVEQICDYIRKNASADTSLSALGSKFNVNMYSLQKSFKKIMGVTPRKYAEECRIQLLKRNLREGEPVPDAIYKTGYNSQSWLYSDASSKLGMSPSSYRKGGEGVTIRYKTALSSLGYLIVAETEKGICLLSLADSEDQLVKHLHGEFPRAYIIRSEDVQPRLNAVLEYFDGQLLSLPVDLNGTEFQRRVWAAISKIPYGETRSYNELADMIGRPKSYRAVANACAANPVPLIVPCHRVVRKDGGLGGYALGTERKRKLLEMESRNKN